MSAGLEGNWPVKRAGVKSNEFASVMQSAPPTPSAIVRQAVVDHGDTGNRHERQRRRRYSAWMRMTKVRRRGSPGSK